MNQMVLKYIIFYLFYIDNIFLILDLNLYPNRAIGSTVFYSLKFNLRVFERDIDYNCGFNPGFKVFLHSPGDPPKYWTNSLKLNLDHQFVLHIKPKMITTSKHLVKYSPAR